MKILAIRGKNLASLEGVFEVDFTSEPLASAGIFAITGSTGSGKSTLLDALCLALFDDTPRTNRAAENISILDVRDKTINQRDSRNLLRRGTSEGYAEVDFVSLGGESFRSRWSVRRSRDKVDGSLQATDFRLTNLSTGLEVPGRKTELLARVVELIGLTFDQFTRAVLLAQGDFATFLKAKQNEKAELLEKLTGTDIYSRISASIYEKSKAADQDLNALKERIQDVELLSEEDLKSLTEEKLSISGGFDSLKKDIALLTAKQQWLREGTVLKKSVQEAEQVLVYSQAVLEKAKPRDAYLARIDGVQEVRDGFYEWKSAERQMVEQKKTLAGKVTERAANDLLFQTAQEKVTVCEEERKGFQEEYSRIEPQIKQARALDIRLAGAAKNAQEAKKTYNEALASQKRAAKAVATHQASLKTAGQALLVINQWFAEKAPYKELVPRMDLIINLLDDVVTSRKQAANHSLLIRKSQVLLEEEGKSLAEWQTEAERLNGLLPAEVAVLREKLEEGVPCPVCGSLHHPLDQVSGESLAEAELNREKKVVQEKIKVLTETMEGRKNEHIRLQSMKESYATQAQEAEDKLNVYLTVLPEWRSSFEQGGLQAELKKIAATWSQYHEELSKVQERISKGETALELEQKSLSDASALCETRAQNDTLCDKEWNALKKERELILSGRSADEVEKECSDKLQKIEERLAQLLREKGDAAARRDHAAGVIAQMEGALSGLSDRCQELKQSVDAWLDSRHGEMTLELLSELLSKDSQWVSAERAALGALRQDEVSARVTLVERTRALTAHAKLEVRASEEETDEVLVVLLSEKSSLLDQKTTRHTEIEVLLSQHERGLKKIKVFEKELTEKTGISENWKKLNDLFGSADGAKFKVLAQGYTLEVLLGYANRHLQALSPRYVLQRVPDTLALQVVDMDMLGEIRAVHSLSGGESFLISLALALGLSSLSSHRMNVESLFIDEGFGSLDMDTLRVAMDALERLQMQGRKIGVISHVAEMTERIATQVRVVRCGSGTSRIEVV